MQGRARDVHLSTPLSLRTASRGCLGRFTAVLPEERRLPGIWT